MFLALREIRRAKARFGLLMAAVALLVFLILTQQALQSGLITSFVGAIERQSAPVLVYSVDGQRTLQGSVITPPLEKRDRRGAGGGRDRAHRAGDVHGRRSTAATSPDAALIGYAKAGARRARRGSAPGGCPAPRARRWGAPATSPWATGSRSRAPRGGPRLRVVGPRRATRRSR